MKNLNTISTPNFENCRKSIIESERTSFIKNQFNTQSANNLGKPQTMNLNTKKNCQNIRKQLKQSNIS